MYFGSPMSPVKLDIFVRLIALLWSCVERQRQEHEQLIRTGDRTHQYFGQKLHWVRWIFTKKVLVCRRMRSRQVKAAKIAPPVGELLIVFIGFSISWGNLAEIGSWDYFPATLPPRLVHCFQFCLHTFLHFYIFLGKSALFVALI